MRTDTRHYLCDKDGCENQEQRSERQGLPPGWIEVDAAHSKQWGFLAPLGSDTTKKSHFCSLGCLKAQVDADLTELDEKDGDQ